MIWSNIYREIKRNCDSRSGKYNPDLAQRKADKRKVEKKLTDNKNASKQTLLDSAVEGCFMSGVGDTSANSIGISYDAIVTPVSEAVTNTAIASVLFIIAWDAV